MFNLRNRFDGEPKSKVENSYAFNSYSPGAHAQPLGPRRHGAGLNSYLDKQPQPGQAPAPQRKFSSEERILVKKVLANIVNFLKEDNLTATQIFGQYDYGKTNSISSRDCERALYDDLFIEQDMNCELFVEYYKDQNERINLKMLYSDLDRFSKARQNNKQFDMSRLQRQINDNPMAVLSKERLVGYSHPMESKADRAHVDKMKSRTDTIRDFFFLQYGYNFV